MQRMDRDTQTCAFKCCEAIVNGQPRPVFKDPITDKGKQSKQGRLKLVRQGGKLTTLCDGKGAASEDLLVEVFRDGVLKKDWTFAEVRKESEKGLVVGIW